MLVRFIVQGNVFVNKLSFLKNFFILSFIYSMITDCFRLVVIMLALVTHCIELDPAVLIYLVLYFLR